MTLFSTLNISSPDPLNWRDYQTLGAVCISCGVGLMQYHWQCHGWGYYCNKWINYSHSVTHKQTDRQTDITATATMSWPKLGKAGHSKWSAWFCLITLFIQWSFASNTGLALLRECCQTTNFWCHHRFSSCVFSLCQYSITNTYTIIINDKCIQYTATYGIN